MKVYRSLGLALYGFLLLAGLAMAQSEGPPETAAGAVDWLLANVEAWGAVLLGVISVQLTKVPKAWIPDSLRNPLQKTIVVSASILIPALLTFVFTALYPLAGFLDAGGFWPVLVAVAGSGYVWYRLESVLSALQTWLLLRSQG